VQAAVIHEYGDADVFRIEEVEKPTPGTHDVLVRARAASVNPVDTKIRSGSQRGVVRLKLPWILGLDVAGVVEAVGSGVTRFSVGDEVMSTPTHRRPGTYAEWIAIDEKSVAPKPKSVDFIEAATLPLVGLTAWECLVTRAKIQPGQKVLIHAGAGGVGVIAIQIAKHFGAYVAATASTRNVDFLLQLGADEVVDYTKEEFDQKLHDYDVVLESLGPDIAQRSLAVLKKGGILTSINTGLPAATERYGPNLGVLVVGMRVLSNAIGTRLFRGIRFTTVVRAADGNTLAELGKLVDARKIRPVVAQVFPLERIAEAHLAQETGRTRGKLAIRL
jgi:NADPH:quinone reductase-like Zn-dependent oxidoreductase